MLGVVRAEAYFAFNGEDVQYGIEADRRSKILRTFVRNTYSYHLSEILATIVNEYTDWERPVQHPINIRDETLEALSDAQYVAPVVHTADLHSAEHRNSYLYVFDYQTKFADYPQVSLLWTQYTPVPMHIAVIRPLELFWCNPKIPSTLNVTKKILKLQTMKTRKLSTIECFKIE